MQIKDYVKPELLVVAARAVLYWDVAEAERDSERQVHPTH